MWKFCYFSTFVYCFFLVFHPLFFFNLIKPNFCFLCLFSLFLFLRLDCFSSLFLSSFLSFFPSTFFTLFLPRFLLHPFVFLEWCKGDFRRAQLKSWNGSQKDHMTWQETLCAIIATHRLATLRCQGTLA